MGRTPSCGKLGLKRGPWTPEEDLYLTNYVKAHGEGRWRSLSKKAGLVRSGKSCRMRWLNYLQPDVKRGRILPDEEDLILRLHRLLGNRWSLIAGRLPGRTDNDVKNYWNSHLSKKLISQGIDPRTHRPLSESEDTWWNPEDSDMKENILRYTTSQESVNPETHDKDSDLVKADHQEDQICSSVATPGISCLHTIQSSASEIVGYGEVSKSNCCETPKQEPFSIRFPYSLPATPTAYGNTFYINPSFLQSFINEDLELSEDNSASKLFPHQSDLANPNNELWSPSTQYHPSR